MANRTKQKIWIGLFVLLSIWVGLHHVWLSGAISGYVTDENNQPVQGATVMTSWRLRNTIGNPLPPLMLRESVTDANGRFTINGWGPKFSARGFMDEQEPISYVVREGYLPTKTYAPGWQVTEEHRLVWATPKTSVLRLQLRSDRVEDTVKRRNTIEEYLFALTSYEEGSAGCVWDDVPRFARALASIETTSSSSYIHFSRRLCDRTH
jgi:hypothetical protein